MKTSRAHAYLRGFSLIEVLIAVVVMSFGLLALAALQARLIQNSADAKAQSVAVALAKDKLEEFRGYQCLSSGSCTLAYADIATGNDAVADNSGSTGGVDFTRTWTVKRYVLPAAGGSFCVAGSSGCTSGFAPNSEFKTIDIRVGWTDATGQTRVVAMEDAIAGLNPADTARNLMNRGGRSRGPRVIIYDPSSDAGVIPIALGDGSETAATNPKPVNVSRSGSDAIETRFDVLTYSALTGGTALAQSRVETTVVGCTCTNATTSTTGYRPTYWDGTRYVPPKRASSVATARAANVTQSRYCDVCCRDHHDDGVTAGDPKYSPRRASHTHYKLNNSNQLVIAGANDNYLEACRLIRVDGIFDVAADLSNDYYNLLPTAEDASSPVPSEADPDAVTAYQDFVLSYLTNRYVTPGPSIGQESLVYNNRTSPAPSAAAGTTLDRDPIAISAAADATTDQNTKWLHSRGLYVDFLDKDALDRIGDAKANCVPAPATPTATQLRDCVLRVLPFTSINLTELADWNPAAGRQIKVTATSDFDTSINFTDPIRGKVTPGTNPTPNSTENATTVVTSSNSGIAVMPDINPDDVASATETNMNDSQAFVIGSGSGGSPGGTFTMAFSGYGGSGVPDTGFTYGIRSDVCGGSPVTCATRQNEALPSAITVRIGNYNKLFAGVDGDQIINPCKTNKSTNMDYRAVYDVTGITSSNGSAVVGSPLNVLNDNKVGAIPSGEYTETLVTSIAQGDTITFALSTPTYRCPINQSESFNPATQCGGNNGQDPIWDWGDDKTGAVCTSGGGSSPPNNP